MTIHLELWSQLRGGGKQMARPQNGTIWVHRQNRYKNTKIMGNNLFSKCCSHHPLLLLLLLLLILLSTTMTTTTAYSLLYMSCDISIFPKMIICYQFCAPNIYTIYQHVQLPVLLLTSWHCSLSLSHLNQSSLFQFNNNNSRSSGSRWRVKKESASWLV